MTKKVSLETIRNLVNEVTKTSPNQLVVKQLMEEAGLQYETDLMKQIGSVLHLVSNTPSPVLNKRPKDVEL